LDRLKEKGIKVKRTDRDGEVHVIDVKDVVE
jgi:beta-lactamase superfamily II metal-dependent hydrolase